jgi:hypothetical protein
MVSDTNATPAKTKRWSTYKSIITIMTVVLETWKEGSANERQCTNRQSLGTCIVLDVQIAVGLQENAHNLGVALIGGQMQGTSAVLWTQNTHSHTQKRGPQQLKREKPSEASHTTRPYISVPN